MAACRKVATLLRVRPVRPKPSVPAERRRTGRARGSLGMTTIRFAATAASILQLAVVTGLAAQAPAGRPMVPGDVYRIKDVGAPEISPDGRWIAYTVSESDS